MKKIIFLLLPLLLIARGGELRVPGRSPEEPPQEKPWFTGPLLTPSPYIVPYGKTNLEPYLTYGTSNGSYDNDWHYKRGSKRTTVTPLLVGYVGISETIAFKFVESFSYRKRDGKSTTLFNDIYAEFDFGLYKEKPTTQIPSMKIIIREFFPTGQFQKLDPVKLGTDASGTGSFRTLIGMILGRAYHIWGIHWFRWRFFPSYTYSAPVHVRGFNAYGGGYSTAGKVYPGHTFSAFLGLEFSLTQRWVLAMDIRSISQSKKRFKGQKGFTSTGAVASVGGKSNHNFAIAPAIEYSFNKKAGLVGGPYFTFAGKNSGQFLNWVIAFNYYN